VSGDELMLRIVPDSAGVFRFDVEYQLNDSMVHSECSVNQLANESIN